LFFLWGRPGRKGKQKRAFCLPNPHAEDLTCGGWAGQGTGLSAEDLTLSPSLKGPTVTGKRKPRVGGTRGRPAKRGGQGGGGGTP